MFDDSLLHCVILLAIPDDAPALEESDNEDEYMEPDKRIGSEYNTYWQ